MKEYVGRWSLAVTRAAGKSSATKATIRCCIRASGDTLTAGPMVESPYRSYVARDAEPPMALSNKTRWELAILPMWYPTIISAHLLWQLWFLTAMDGWPHIHLSVYSHSASGQIMFGIMIFNQLAALAVTGVSARKIIKQVKLAHG